MSVVDKPTELVLRDGNKEEITIMLDYRWRHGWKLDRIIDHGEPDKCSAPVVIYYFVRYV